MQGNLLTSDLSCDTRNALEKTIKFIEKDLGVKMKEIHLPKLKSSVQIWTANMSHEQGII